MGKKTVASRPDQKIVSIFCFYVADIDGIIKLLLWLLNKSLNHSPQRKKEKKNCYGGEASWIARTGFTRMLKEKEF